MKELETTETPDVAGGSVAAPYPTPGGSTPPFVPIMPGPHTPEPTIVEQSTTAA